MENPLLKGLNLDEVQENRKLHRFNELESTGRKRIIQLLKRLYILNQKVVQKRRGSNIEEVKIRLK